MLKFKMYCTLILPIARQSPDKSCIAPQILKTSDDLHGSCLFLFCTVLHFLMYSFQNHVDVSKTVYRPRGLPAHEEEDEGDDAEDDDDHCKAGEHCRRPDVINFLR